MLKTTELTHLLISHIIKEGSRVVDATAGNGHDTLFLSNLVGKSGKVFAYDIQEQAINNAKELTKDKTNIEYFLKSHEFIDQTNLDLVLFNLGFLPNGDKSITTLKDSTINSIINLINNYSLNPNLHIFIVVYPGHPEGKIESDELLSFTKQLDKHLLVTTYIPHNQNNAPYLITINKKQKAVSNWHSLFFTQFH